MKPSIQLATILMGMLLLTVLSIAASAQVPSNPPLSACHQPPAFGHPLPPAIGHPPPHHMENGIWDTWKEEVKSEKTIEELENLHFRIRKSEISIRAQIDEAQLDLQREMARKIPDTEKLQDIIQRLNKARGEMFRLHVLGQAEAKRIIAQSKDEN